MNCVKAIIPAAGFGTRFLPATKAVPKELLPILDKPSIQYVVEEALKSGIKDFVVVTGKNKKAIEDHFDNYLELEQNLATKGKDEVINSINKITDSANFMYVKQKKPLGLGHAIWIAKQAFSKQPVAILLPDDIFSGSIPAISQLIKVSKQEKCSVIAVQEVPNEEASRYGIIDIRRQFSPNLYQVKDLIEKPAPGTAPSNLAIVGRYILSPDIFESLEDLHFGANGEIQLTDGIQNLLLSGEKIFAYKIKGQRYDAGTIIGWLKTNIEFALKHPNYSKEISQHLALLDREILIMQGKTNELKRIKI